MDIVTVAHVFAVHFGVRVRGRLTRGGNRERNRLLIEVSIDIYDTKHVSIDIDVGDVKCVAVCLIVVDFVSLSLADRSRDSFHIDYRLGVAVSVAIPV